MTGGLILAIDASARAGSVALLRGGIVVAERVLSVRGERAERLLPAVAAVLEEARVKTAELDRVVCGAGPGSFTGLRVAASIAKGIAVASERPLFALSSLLLLVAGATASAAPGRYLAVLDALRGEVFAAGYEVTAAGSLAVVAEPSLVRADRVDHLAAALKASAIGPGRALEGHPLARGVARAMDWIERSSPVDLVTWEPDYGRLPEAQVRWEAAHRRPLTQA